MLALIAVGAVASILFAVTHLDWIARWAIHRAFPGVRAEMSAMSVRLPGVLEVWDLELKSTASNETLLMLRGGRAVFHLTDLFGARIEELRLENPDLIVSPDLGEALGVEPRAADAAEDGDPFAWSIGRLVIDEGRVRIARLWQDSPVVEMFVSAELPNFGVGGELGTIVHQARIEKIVAKDGDSDPMLEIAGIDVAFTTEGLFSHKQIEAARIGEGQLVVTSELIEFFNKPSAEPEGERKAGWRVGSLELDGMDVTIPDAPGMLGRVDFRIQASLRDIGSMETGTDGAGQSVVVSDLQVFTEAEPERPMFTATSARVAFTMDGLASHRIASLDLENPTLDLDVSSLSGSPGQKTLAPAGPSLDWIVESARCRYGTLRLRGLRDGDLETSAHFAFDFEKFGITGEAAETVHTLTLWGIEGFVDAPEPFVTLDLVRVEFSPVQLLRDRHIASIKIDGGRLRVGGALQKLLAHNGKTPDAAKTPDENGGWTIGEIDISNVRTRIDDERPEVTDVFFTLNTVLHDVTASGLSSQLVNEVQTVEFADVVLRSPLDRSRKVLSLRSVFVRFTLGDLAEQHLREVVILRPTIYLSQDLFVYMERATAAEEGAEDSSSEGGLSGWSVEKLDVKFGKLVIGSGERSDVGLPIEFETQAQNVALNNLADLNLQVALRVPKQSRSFPDYQLELKDVQGDLRFAYPPEKGEKNLVQKLDLAEVRWRQFESKDAWIAVTFDVKGINGEFGAAAYSGYLNGGFSFFFQQDSPWIGWVAGTGLDTHAVTNVLSPQNFQMTGPIDFQIQLDAFRKDIDRVQGDFKITEPGHFKIGKLDDLIARIPDTWTSLKQDSTRIALETLRDFDYTDANGRFWFVESQGILNLDLSGPNGSRIFEVVLHDGPDTNNPWQQGKLGKQ